MHATEEICADSLRRVLGSLYPEGDQLLSDFLYGVPGAPPYERRFGARIYVREAQFIDALLYIRTHGAAFLRDISVGSLWSMLTNFVTENYWTISEGRLRLNPGVSLSEQISPSGLEKLVSELRASAMFNPLNDTTIYPLVVVQVRERFHSTSFSLSGADGLSDSLQAYGTLPASLLPNQFPPIGGMAEVFKPTSTWLCVRAPDSLIARKRACAVLGAIALSPIRRERYLQTGRSVHGGHCSISDRQVSCSPGSDAMTPRLSSDIVLSRGDHQWLSTLGALIESNEHSDKSRVRALEYFHRAWFESPRERFPTLCMALDSLVVAQERHTRAAIDFVLSTVNASVDRDRLHLLLKLRGAVVHGAAPDVYESQHYEAYYSRFGDNPITDLELVVACCLRRSIFGGQLSLQPDPHAEVVRQAQQLGRLPVNLRGRSIIPDD